WPASFGARISIIQLRCVLFILLRCTFIILLCCTIFIQSNGDEQADALFEALRTSSAVREGFITALEECELMIPGIGHDKISDLTTNILRGHLVEYTKAQCDLLAVPVQNVPIAPIFNTDAMQWEEQYVDLPVWHNRPILLVPKSAVRYSPAYQQDKYYQHYVLNFLKARELNNPHSALVRLIKNKSAKTARRVVLKKDLAAQYPRAKEFLFEFSRQNPEVLRAYREDLKQMETTDTASDVDSVTKPSSLKPLQKCCGTLELGMITRQPTTE